MLVLIMMCLAIFCGCLWSNDAFSFFSLCSYVRAKSDLSVEDVTELVEIGLQIFHSSQDKLYAQVRKLIP